MSRGCLALMGLLWLLPALTRAAPPEYPSKDTPEAAIHRGGVVFQYYCILCHGAKGDGTGRAAKLYDPKPANLVLSNKNDQYKELIIRMGGKAVGRSEFMPSWGNELTNEQIADVIAHLRSIRSPAVVMP
ncbi:MAG: mono/diheme cytochrome c family protein [Bradyrhizobium sp.]|jgi:mono/diheme cytochrome c family protein